MTITPDGLPAWTRTAGIEQYGGHADKQNYLTLGAIDPTTDITAEGYARLTADMAAAAVSAPLAVITFTNRTAASGNPPLVEWVLFMPSGELLVSYEGDDPPAGFPEAAQVGAGHVQFTFEASYTDLYGVTGTFSPKHALATGHGSTFLNCTTVVSGPSDPEPLVDVYCFDAAGAAVESRRVTLVVL